MEHTLLVRDLCLPVPRAWFDENRTAIETRADARPDRALFEAVVATYQQLAGARLLSIRVPASAHVKHGPLLGAMRALAHEQFARNLFVNEVPREIVLEIARHLDLSSLRAWRRADPYVARLHPCLPPVINWEAVTMKYVEYGRILTQPTLDFFSRICQAAYVDDAMTVQSLWSSRVEHISSTAWNTTWYIRPILAAIARGHSVKVWRSFPYGGITPVYLDNMNPATFMLHEALSLGRFGFARNVLGVTNDTILRTLRIFDFHGKGRYEKRQRHPVIDMLRQRHFSHVTWFIDNSKEQYATGPPKVLLDACVAYGHAAILDRWPTVFDRATLTYVIAHGDSSDGLHWLETHRSDIFFSPRKGERMPIKKTILTQAIKHGQPEILQWLVARAYLDLIHPESGWKFVDCSLRHKNMRTLAWFNGYMQQQTPVPEWYVKWLASHKEQCSFIK